LARRIRYDNLTGGLNTVSSLGTINQSDRRTETPDCQNVEYFLLGGLKSMDGNTKFGNTQGYRISCGFEYKLNNIKYMITTNTHGEVRVYNPSTQVFDLIYTFPNATTRHSIIAYSNGVVISNGVNDMLYYQKGRNDLQSGSISGTAGTKDVVGIDTTFKNATSTSSSLHVGEYINVGGDIYIVDTITDDNHLTVTQNITTTFTNATFRLTEISLCNATLVNTDDSSVSLPIRGLAMNVYRGRIVVGGNDNNLYYSELGKFYGWDIKYDAGAIPPFYNDTSDIHALGLYGEDLLIHRQDFTYLLNGSNTPDTWNISPFADISCESQQSFVTSNNSYYVYSRRNGGIYPLLKRNMFSDKYVGDELSVKIRNIFEQLNTSKLNEIYCVSHPTKRWLVMYMPFIQGIDSNIAMVYDFQTNSWLRRVVPQQVTCAFRYMDKVYIGTSDGKVLEEFNGLTFDGTKIPFYWKSPWFDFGDGSNFHSVREFRIQIGEDFNENFYVKNHRDGTSESHERLVKNKSGLTQALIWSDDAGLLTDSVWDDYEWADGGFTTYRFPLANASYMQQMQIELAGNMQETESDSIQGMAVYGFELHGIELEERPWA
jgi:hypothetical protein